VARLTAEDVRAARERRQEPERARAQARPANGNGHDAAPAVADETALAQASDDAG
jgi:hypothetical protein